MSSPAQFALFAPVEDDIRRRVNNAFASNLTNVERYVLQSLIRENSFGRSSPLSIARMQSWWVQNDRYMATDRAIKDAVKGLLENHGLPIGSCRTPGQNGYYFITSDADAEEASRPLQNEIYSMFRRLKVINPKSAFVRQLQGQIQLLSEESNGT